MDSRESHRNADYDLNGCPTRAHSGSPINTAPADVLRWTMTYRQETLHSGNWRDG